MKKILLTIFVVSLSCFACSYNMEVKNQNRYSISPSYSAAAPQLNIGVPSFMGARDDQLFYNAVLEKLSSKPFVGKIEAPFRNNGMFNPDLAITIDPHVEYSGSGWNYPITFPGFLIFTHAWNGYVYKANIITKITIHDFRTNSSENFEVQTSYDLRQCDFGRGFWASSGWWMPGFGATALIAGFFMIQYDDDLTPEFENRMKDTYGGYVAEQISATVDRRLAQYPQLSPTEAAKIVTPPINVAQPVLGPAATQQQPAGSGKQNLESDLRKIMNQ